jgi:hypothetical protein
MSISTIGYRDQRSEALSATTTSTLEKKTNTTVVRTSTCVCAYMPYALYLLSWLACTVLCIQKGNDFFSRVACWTPQAASVQRPDGMKFKLRLSFVHFRASCFSSVVTEPTGSGCILQYSRVLYSVLYVAVTHESTELQTVRK